MSEQNASTKPTVRDYLAEFDEAAKPARALLMEVGRYTNYMRTVVRAMLPYFPKDDLRHVGFSEAAEGIEPAHVPVVYPETPHDAELKLLRILEAKSRAMFDYTGWTDDVDQDAAQTVIEVEAVLQDLGNFRLLQSRYALGAFNAGEQR